MFSQRRVQKRSEHEIFLLDIDECREKDIYCGTSSAVNCKNTNGEFECYCNIGYRFEGGPEGCIGKRRPLSQLSRDSANLGRLSDLVVVASE